MSVDSKAFQQPMISSGLFTSASGTPLDVTETLGYSPSMVICFVDTDLTNPDIYIASAADTAQSLFLQGSDGVVTRVAVATGLDITSTGFIARLEIQTADSTNYWIAFR